MSFEQTFENSEEAAEICRRATKSSRLLDTPPYDMTADERAEVIILLRERVMDLERSADRLWLDGVGESC